MSQIEPRLLTKMGCSGLGALLTFQAAVHVAIAILAICSPALALTQQEIITENAASWMKVQVIMTAKHARHVTLDSFIQSVRVMRASGQAFCQLEHRHHICITSG